MAISEGRQLSLDAVFKSSIDQHELADIITAAKGFLGELSCLLEVEGLCVDASERAHEGSVLSEFVQRLGFRAPPTRRILDSISTKFEPGRLCLLIGPPQSGKSTLLRAISGRLPKECKSSGHVRVDGKELKDLNEGQVRQVVGYIPPTDEHAAVLTVEETLNFAWECTMSDHFNSLIARYNLTAYAERTKPKVVLLLHTFGLTGCRQSMIGDSRIRGVSGGEKKRVTIAEQLVRNFPVCAMDEISTGLDAKVAFDMVRALKTETQMLKTTRIIALLQPPPPVYQLFDDIFLLGSNGQLLYHGPLALAEEYLRCLVCVLDTPRLCASGRTCSCLQDACVLQTRINHALMFLVLCGPLLLHRTHARTRVNARTCIRAHAHSHLGFRRPEDMDLIDFLIDVSNECAAHMYFPLPSESVKAWSWRGELPPGNEEMVSCWRKYTDSAPASVGERPCSHSTRYCISSLGVRVEGLGLAAQGIFFLPSPPW
jgi:ABC-type multidrug transport system ATPase subunit